MSDLNLKTSSTAELQNFTRSMVLNYYQSMFHLMSEFIPRERLGIAHHEAMKVAMRESRSYKTEVQRG